MGSTVHAVRDLDLAAIDAVGFDLDHTLAVYDDARVNAIAFEETCAFLLEAGFTADPRSYDETQASRGLLLDTQTGATVKADAHGRIRRAWQGETWLADDAIGLRYPDPVGATSRFHTIHSPFDLPAAVFFQSLAGTNDDPAGLCLTIRRELDRSHTRGRLKRRILDDAGRLVRPLADGAAPFHALRRGGKRLFVLTNSEADYATALLERLFGGEWRTLFDAVVPHAEKPAFFRRGASDLEVSLGAKPERILYIGDSVKSDTEPARARGWRTAHVIQELGDSSAAAGRWGDPLVDAGTPTWFARLIVEHADVYAARVGDIIDGGATARFHAGAHPLAATPGGDSA